MSNSVQVYTVSYQGAPRALIGVVGLALPIVLLCAFFGMPDLEMEWHVSGAAKVLTQILLFTMLVTMATVSAYAVFVVKTVEVDLERGTVNAFFRVMGREVKKKGWMLAEFIRVEIKHRCAGEDTDYYQTDVGLKHSSGKIIWLRAFLSKNSQASAEALSFISTLKKDCALSDEHWV